MSRQKSKSAVLGEKATILAEMTKIDDELENLRKELLDKKEGERILFVEKQILDAKKKIEEITKKEGRLS